VRERANECLVAITNCFALCLCTYFSLLAQKITCWILLLVLAQIIYVVKLIYSVECSNLVHLGVERLLLLRSRPRSQLRSAYQAVQEDTKQSLVGTHNVQC